LVGKIAAIFLGTSNTLRCFALRQAQCDKLSVTSSAQAYSV